MRISEMFANNLHLKALALLLASILWLFVMAERDSEIEVNATIEVINLANNLAVSSTLPQFIDLKIAGPKILLMKPSIKKLTVPLDMGNLKPGMVLFTGFEKKIQLPPGVRLTRINPTTLEICLITK